MKKTFILSFMLLFFITGCSLQADDIAIPKGYIGKKEYYDKVGFQDYIDYAKYIYSEPDVIIFDDDYKKISQEDIESIKGYFEDFKSRMESSNRLNEYDFKENVINEGDYIRIKTKEGQKIGDSEYTKYDNYSIYYFDIDSLTLYYIHSNI